MHITVFQSPFSQLHTWHTSHRLRAISGLGELCASSASPTTAITTNPIKTNPPSRLIASSPYLVQLP
jgi:hypothetical protein